MKVKLLIVLALLITVSFAQVITVAEARAAVLGTSVTTTGIVTTPNMGSAGSSDYTFQDATAGMKIYTGAFDAALSLGDSIVITGVLQDYNSLLEIVPAASDDITVVTRGNPLPAFQPVTISGFLTDPDSFESELVQIYRVEIVDGTWPSSGSNADMIITDDDSVSTMIFRVDRHSDVDDNPQPTGFFDLKGTIAQYDYTDPFDGGYSLIPRFIQDIETPDGSIATVMDARLTGIGETATTRGFITTPSFSTSSSDYGLQDATGGIAIYGSGITPTLEYGDFITVTGQISSYGDKIQIQPSTASDITVLSTGNTVPAIQSMTIAEFLLDPGAYESELFQFDIAEITGGDPWPTSGNDANVTITDVSDSSLTMRVDKDTDLDENLVPQGTFNVAGIIDRFYDYQIKPRYMADIEILGDVSPVIMNIVHLPANPIPTDIVTVTADVIDDGTVTVNLNYMVGSGAYTPIAMTAGAGFEYSGAIPAQTDGSFVYYYISADDGVNAVVNSDTTMYAVWAPSSLTPIYNVQYTTNASGDSPLLDQTVTIGGIVTAEFWGGSYNSYLFVQDEDSAWCGVLVYRYAGWDGYDFTTPLGDTVHTVAEGDSVVLTGTVAEFNGVTEIDNVTEFVVYGTAVGTRTPLLVTTGEIMTGGTMMEAYEGVLIKVEDVTVDNPDLGHGEWSVTDGTNSVMLDDVWEYYYDPVQDQELDKIVGVMTYTYSNAKILPRLARDIVQSGTARFQRIQQMLYSDLLKAATDAESDISYALGDTVSLAGIVTMPTGLSYAGDGIKFIFGDQKGGPWSAILSYAPDSSEYPVLYEGDSIVATGYISEYTTNEANMTELFITQPINLVSIGTVPPVSYVTAGDLMYPTTAEQWGNVTVRIGASEIVEIGSMGSNDGGFKIDDGTGELWIDHDSDSIETYWETYGIPPLGTEIDSITGWVYHHFGSYADSTTYKLAPLYVDDIAIPTVGVDNNQLPESYALYQNYPNPFNPETRIQFRLAAGEQVKLVIYDIKGRQVRTLVNEKYDAGHHTITWDGKNSKGVGVASGMYIYRIKAGSFLASQKMLLLR